MGFEAPALSLPEVRAEEPLSFVDMAVPGQSLGRHLPEQHLLSPNLHLLLQSLSPLRHSLWPFLVKRSPRRELFELAEEAQVRVATARRAHAVSGCEATD